jgi:hypothetical protein
MCLKKLFQVLLKCEGQDVDVSVSNMEWSWQGLFQWGDWGKSQASVGWKVNELGSGGRKSWQGIDKGGQVEQDGHEEHNGTGGQFGMVR